MPADNLSCHLTSLTKAVHQNLIKKGFSEEGLLQHHSVVYITVISLEVFVETAKVFWSGRSQAVRLPKAFRLEQDEVRIRRHGSAVILEPIPTDWAWLDAIAGTIDPDFEQAASEQAHEEQRPELGFFE